MERDKMTLKTKLLFVAAAVLANLAFGQQPPAQLLTRTDLPGLSGGGGSYAPQFSADGQWVVFTSRARNLVTNDNSNDRLNVYVYDLNSASTRLVSVNTSGTGGGNGNSFNPAISSNGQFIAFESSASDLVTNDHNRTVDIFLRDLVSGTTSLISLSLNAPTAANGASRKPTMTPDGRY